MATVGEGPQTDPMTFTPGVVSKAGGVAGGTLTASASPGTANPNQVVTLTVSGGTGPYTWSLVSGTGGTLSSTTGAQVTYPASATVAGSTDVWHVADSASNTANVTVTVAPGPFVLKRKLVGGTPTWVRCKLMRRDLVGGTPQWVWP